MRKTMRKTIRKTKTIKTIKKYVVNAYMRDYSVIIENFSIFNESRQD